MNALTREVIVGALTLLADRLEPDEPRVELIIVGGAAMVLLFGARDSTKDVDAFHVDLDAKSRVAEAAANVAMKLSAWRDDLDVEDARRLLQECRGTREDVWREVEPFVVPGRGMKARYAFDDLWESEHGTA